MKTSISARYSLVNGRLVTHANAHRLRLESTRLCTNIIHSRINPKTYFEKYIIIHGPKGYAWKEITHGCGGGGWQKSLRMLVVNTVYGLGAGHHRVYFTDGAGVDIPAVQAAWDAHADEMRRRFPKEKRADWSDGARAIVAPKHLAKAD